MLNKVLEDVESIINTLACNESQPIEIRGAFNAAINLRAMLEQINPADMPEPKKEEIKLWVTPKKKDNEDNKTKE